MDTQPQTFQRSCCDDDCMATVVRAKFDTADVERAARGFEAVGEETRLKILKLLSQHDALCVCEIQQAFDLGQSTISHHLRVLREAGLVDAMRRGTWAYYSLKKDAVKWLIKDLMTAV